jgi:hypothetical protein
MTTTEATLAVVTRFENEFNTRDLDAIMADRWLWSLSSMGRQGVPASEWPLPERLALRPWLAALPPLLSNVQAP